MKNRLEELMQLVDPYQSHYEHLTNLISREKAALIDLDLDKLQQITKAKETCMLKIKILVPTLSQAIKDCALALGMGLEPLPALAELASEAPEPWSGRLTTAGLNLARLKRGIAINNQANHDFVQEALDLISGSISILTGANMSTGQGYTASGQKAPQNNSRPVKLSREV